MAKVVGTFFNMKMSGTMGDMVFDQRGFVRLKGQHPNLNSASQGDFRQTMTAAQKCAKVCGPITRFINPPEMLKAEAERSRAERDRPRRFPEEPERDVLLFLLENAPLKPWQHDILAIVRDEAYYFAPQGQSKIMNEGWASYWHSTIMTRHCLDPSELIDYADHHSGTMVMSGGRLNPYKLGIELFRDIERRWNRGQFGPEWEACDDMAERARWDRRTNLGREKIFEVRRLHSDGTFLDEFLTPITAGIGAAGWRFGRRDLP